MPAALALVLCLLLPAVARAQTCSDDLTCGYNACRTPATPVPASLWGEIRPAEAAIPALRDTTNHTGFVPYDGQWPFWVSMDVENNWIFTATNVGFEIWNATVSPASPTRSAMVDGRSGGFPRFLANPESKFPVTDADAPEGNDTLLAVGGTASVGLSIWNTTIKSSPRAVYQDYGEGKEVQGVYAATFGGTSYAFAASTQQGAMIYNMTQAATSAVACTEQTPAVACAGVWQGTLGSRTNVSYISGVGPLVTLSSGVSPRGIEIWNLSNPSFPVLAATGLTSEIAFGHAMWSDGGSYFLAVRATGNAVLRIYDVSCAVAGGCGTLGGPIATVNVSDPANSKYLVTFSRSGSTPFLHLGSDRICAGTERREWLFDVSNPLAPRDVTPADGVANGFSSGYWQWYQRATPTGFNNVGPRRAKFNGEYLYRAAFAIFDIHKRGGGEPFPSFNWAPTEIYPGTSVSFTDFSGGSPTSWSWTFQDGTPASSTAQNPAGVTFSTSGTKSVTLQVCNGVGCDSLTRSLAVIGPGAGVTGVTVSPTSLASCQTATFTATGISGVAPISYSWSVRSGGGIVTPIPSCTGNPCSWVAPADFASGTYRAYVTVSNAANPGGSTVSEAFSLTQQPLAFTHASGGPTNDPSTSGTVQFHVQSTGAEAWSWDFGDGAGFGSYSTDPVNGPNPRHTYTVSGSKNVRVRIRSCNGSVLESATLAVTVNVEGTLAAGFFASGCTFGICSFNTGQTITFTDFSTGSPDTWAYDWNHTSSSTTDCNFSGGSSSPQTSHVYNTAGTYRPCLRVSRGAQTSVTVHAAITVSDFSGIPAITISGPSGGTINQTLTFSASASNCSPSPSGWQWSTDGGVGTSTSSSIVVSWSSAGTKNLSVTNSGCAGATGTRPVTISSSSGGALVASYVYTPTTISSGQAATFNGTSSLGNPTVFQWDFGDNTPQQDGSIVQHTFAAAGSYQVKLTVAKPGTGDGCAFGFCTDEEIRTVVVQQGSGGGSCGSDPDALCLGGGRFKVKIGWKTPDGTTGVGHPVPITDDTGYFWFFNVQNVEVVTKALDGCGVNGHYWVFAAGLTNVEVNMTVTDRQTGVVKTYSNAMGNAFNPIQDTAAFSCTGSKILTELFAVPPVADPVEYVEINEGDPIPAGRPYILSGTREVTPAATCTPDNATLCLNNNRFRVDASWSTPNGAVGLGQAVRLTGDTGYFWFFNSANVEIIIKVLDGCQINTKYWVFAGGLTNVEVAITVTDTSTGAYKTYFNPQGTAFQPQQDTSAISNCP